MSDLTTGIAYGSLFSDSTTSRANYGDHGPQGQYSFRVATSYITGSHAFKAGFTTFTGEASIGGNPVYDEQYVFRNNLPVSLVQASSSESGVCGRMQSVLIVR